MKDAHIRHLPISSDSGLRMIHCKQAYLNSLTQVADFSLQAVHLVSSEHAALVLVCLRLQPQDVAPVTRYMMIWSDPSS